ncbi:MAG: RluA family pseudouridine synthase [Acidimicrobiales bacterium]
MSELSVHVPPSLDGVRVDRAVALLADVSRSVVDTLVSGGRVQVEGETVNARSRPLRQGELLTVQLDDERPVPPPGPDPSVVFEVVHADTEVIVVDKPAGLVVHPGAGHPDGTLVNGILARFPEVAALADEDGVDPGRPGIVHRLDRGTSGLLVVARTPGAYRSLVNQLGARTVSRRYRALVIGAVESEVGVVDAPVGRSLSSPTRMSVSRKGKEARTRYRVERRFGQPVPSTLLEASLETGRTHQIRVHLAAIGHPVVGDEVYGRGRWLPGSTLDRPFLHAFSLAFDHPGTGERVEWTSPLPPDLAGELARLSG